MIRIPSRPNLLLDEDLLPAPSQKRSRKKRSQILSAGLALFREKGFEATSIEEIATRADVAVGGFYQYFRSKRQLLLVLMDELLGRLSALDLRPKGAADIRSGLHAFLDRAVATDVAYFGAYRAWQEAVLGDVDLARKQKRIENWTRARVTAAFTLLHQLPGARQDVDIPELARLMDDFFWHLLGRSARASRRELDAMLNATTHLLYHALFNDSLQAGPETPHGR